MSEKPDTPTADVRAVEMKLRSDAESFVQENQAGLQNEESVEGPEARDPEELISRARQNENETLGQSIEAEDETENAATLVDEGREAAAEELEQVARRAR